MNMVVNSYLIFDMIGLKQVWRRVMETLVEQIKKLGFNEYEAKSYVSLVKLGTVSAYQVSKDSGIPRARIYDVLNSLVEKGIVLKEEIEESAQYSPLPVEIFLQKTQSDWQVNYDEMSKSLKELENYENAPVNRVITLKDRQTILSYCKVLLEKAKKRVVISMWDDMYNLLESDLQEAASRVKVKGITLHVDNPVGDIAVHRITNYTEKPENEHWFILSIDANEMIYGPSLDGRSIAFYTDDPVHIYLLEDYVWHDVLVNRLVARSQEDLGQWITTKRSEFFMEE